MKKGLVTLVVMLCANILLAQTTIKGNVYDIYLEPIASINISTDKGSTVTDEDGAFALTVKQTLPLKINITGVGYQSQVIEVVDFEEINVVLERQSNLQEYIVSASRTPERVLESPVSVERFGASNVKNNSSLNFFEGLVNLKGIDVLHNSYNIKNIVSNRGFANTENTRFVQLIDGIESTVPFLNYSLGNTIGTSDLDIETVEILPGAASALYGPNAFNGISLARTKSPFDYQGISASIKGGVTSQDSAGNNEFIDLGIRMAHAFSDKFAIKANINYNKAEDWHATDNRNTSEQGGTIIDGLSHEDTLDYDGLNVYGDEIDVSFVQLGLLAADIIQTGGTIGLPAAIEQGLTLGTISTFADNQSISRVGYAERDLIDYGTNATRFDGSIHYRPFGTKKLEIELGAKYGIGDNIIHGFNRYSQKNGSTRQYRAVITGDNFSIKGYYTKNLANLVDTRLLGIYINNQATPEAEYFANVLGGVINSTLFNLTNGIDATNEENFRAGQAFAEETKFVVGSSDFNSALARGKATSIQNGGALITDESSFYHIDANYNFKDLIKFVDFQMGGSFREYELNSGGDLFSDFDGPINISEFGIYAQGQKKFLDDHLKVSVTARYDKSENFAFKVSPRTSIAYAIGDSKNHNIRFSYQTGFRNPTSQDQYANTNLGDRRIVGSVRDNLERIADPFEAISESGKLIIQEGVIIGEEQILNNSYTASSVKDFENEAFESILAGASLSEAVLDNSSLLKKAELDYIKPETVQTFELGYRGAVNISNKLFEFDVAGFYNIFENFLTNKSVVVPFYGDVNLTGAIRVNDLPGQALLLTDAEEYIIRTNAKGQLKSYGFNVGFTTEIFNDFKLGASYAFSKLDSDDIEDKDFNPEYNTPENVIKLSFGKEKLFNNFGFQLDARWQDEYLYQSVFIQDIVESRTVIDTQINYSVPSIKSRFKIGATNVGGKDYTSVPGAGSIGSQYYINWTINN